ncbi:hypothetical protein IID19_05885 [Patescibacteria group bacterium]|nr:hypothetical protein [Patescibacteria group bacterium]
MHRNSIILIISAVITVILLILLIDPLMTVMPEGSLLVLLVVLVVASVVFFGYVLTERAQDERESHHRLQAGRFAYLAGSFVLLIGVVVQSIGHNLDSWLAGALLVMVVARLSALLYYRWRG